MSSHPWELAWKEGRWYEASGPFPGVVEFAKYLKEVNAKTVLDFGSGAGRHTLFLANEGLQVVAFDISRSALALLNKRAKTESNGLVFSAQAEMSALPFVNQSFDAIVGNNVLHHSTHSVASLACGEIYRVLRHGGFGYFSVLSRSDYKYGKGEFLEPATFVSTAADELGIVHHFFSEEEVRCLFADFDILSLEEELIPFEKGNRGHFHLRLEKK